MRPIRLIALAMLCAAVILPTAPVRAASCNGASHQVTLRSGSASPGSGTPTTSIRFGVVYASNAGCAPSQITVSVAGIGTFPLSGSGSNYQSGVTFQRTMTLPVGRYSYFFRATSGSGAGQTTVTLSLVNPGNVVISSPNPVPPTPKPPPPPTPKPPPPPTPPPPPPATPTPTSSPTSAASPTPNPASGTPSASADPSGSSAPSPSEAARPTPRTSRIARPTQSPSPSPEGPVAGPLDGGGFGWFDLTGSVPPWVIAYLVTTGAGLAFYVALMRRRAEQEREPAGLPAAATQAVPQSAPASLWAVAAEERALPPPTEGGFLRDDDPANAEPEEANIPRWLRPSVRAARQEGIRYPSRDRWG